MSRAPTGEAILRLTGIVERTIPELISRSAEQRVIEGSPATGSRPSVYVDPEWPADEARLERRYAFLSRLYDAINPDNPTAPLSPAALLALSEATDPATGARIIDPAVVASARRYASLFDTGRAKILLSDALLPLAQDVERDARDSIDRLNRRYNEAVARSSAGARPPAVSFAARPRPTETLATISPAAGVRLRESPPGPPSAPRLATPPVPFFAATLTAPPTVKREEEEEEITLYGLAPSTPSRPTVAPPSLSLALRGVPEMVALFGTIAPPTAAPAVATRAPARRRVAPVRPSYAIAAQTTRPSFLPSTLYGAQARREEEVEEEEEEQEPLIVKRRRVAPLVSPPYAPIADIEEERLIADLARTTQRGALPAVWSLSTAIEAAGRTAPPPPPAYASPARAPPTPAALARVPPRAPIDLVSVQEIDPVVFTRATPLAAIDDEAARVRARARAIREGYATSVGENDLDALDARAQYLEGLGDFVRGSTVRANPEFDATYWFRAVSEDEGQGPLGGSGGTPEAGAFHGPYATDQDAASAAREAVESEGPDGAVMDAAQAWAIGVAPYLDAAPAETTTFEVVRRPLAAETAPGGGDFVRRWDVAIARPWPRSDAPPGTTSLNVLAWDRVVDATGVARRVGVRDAYCDDAPCAFVAVYETASPDDAARLAEALRSFVSTMEARRGTHERLADVDIQLARAADRFYPLAIVERTGPSGGPYGLVVRVPGAISDVDQGALLALVRAAYGAMAAARIGVNDQASRIVGRDREVPIPPLGELVGSTF